MSSNLGPTQLDAVSRRGERLVRRILPVLRVLGAIALLVAATLALLPLMHGGASDKEAERGLFALLLFVAFAPMWVVPWSIFAKQTLRVEGHTLHVETWRGSVSIDLRKVERIWVRRPIGDDGTMPLIGIRTAAGSAWVSWLTRWASELEGEMVALLTEVAAQPDVKTSRRAQAFLRLPGGPGLPERVYLWLRGAALFVCVAVVLAYGCIGYWTLAAR